MTGPKWQNQRVGSKTVGRACQLVPTFPLKRYLPGLEFGRLSRDLRSPPSFIYLLDALRNGRAWDRSTLLYPLRRTISASSAPCLSPDKWLIHEMLLLLSAMSSAYVEGQKHTSASTPPSTLPPRASSNHSTGFPYLCWNISHGRP